ncbi:MAG: hypothetical protein KDD39_03945 [Bdellovibrionales bacterium]|nr:hypothetical protein [Bdellovibrionales bacterium]
MKEKAGKNQSKPKLEIRNATPEDVDGIVELVAQAYPGMPPYQPNMLRGQINNYPEGHFVAVLGGTIVGYCATIRVSEEKALSPHTWREITGGGYGSTHEATGDFLYGYEVCVDPTKRGYKIGQRFYNERKNLCRFLRLKGIVFAGRVPNLQKRLKEVGTIEKYIELVKRKKIRDPVLSFQLKNGFEVLGVFQNYLPHDQQSLGYGVHLAWRNPEYQSSSKTKSEPGSKTKRTPASVRVASIQYKQRRIKSFEEFSKLVEYFVDVVADYRSDFVLFPELFTLQLLSIENEAMPPNEAIEHITKHNDNLQTLFYTLAMKYNVNIIAGSHPKMVAGNVQNVSSIFLRDGSVHEQAKIHPTPNERYWWNIQGGDDVSVINTDCGPIGVLICYDSEFPELARHLTDQGMTMLFVPFLTDERKSYCRVRYCAQARAVENQIYVAMSGSVGNLPNVRNIDIHYAQSCILTPCDFPFARDGIAADTTPNVEMVAFADLNIQDLIASRSTGTVRNLTDRRHDLYSVRWHSKK